MVNLSVVIPVYKAERIIKILLEKLHDSLQPITKNYEIILIEDSSPDNSWKEIENFAQKDSRIKGLKLSKNFGQHAAIYAGLKHAQGEWIIVMDCDLQDKPEEIPVLYSKVNTGYDIVYAKRTNRKDSFIKKLSSKMFYRVLSYLTETPQSSEIANFGIYKKKVITSILEMHDYIRYFPSMAKWVGFNTASVEVSHDNRYEGKSSYNWHKLLRLALQVVLSFSDKPLRLALKFGLLISGGAFIFALLVLIRSLLGQYTVSGYASMMISIWFLAGIIITLIGMVGLYIGKIFDQVKSRPIYIVSERINMDE